MRKLIVSTLCLVVLVAGLSWLGVQIADYQRQQIARTLAERIQSGSEAQAVAAVGELPRLNEAGLASLVAAAGSSRPRVAPAARWAVDDLLLQWKDESTKNSKQYAKRLTLLANEMATQVSQCSPEGQRWLRELASQVLLAAGEVSPGDSPLLVAQCDTVLRKTNDIQPLPVQEPLPAQELAQPNRSKPTPSDRLAALPLAALPVVAEQLPSSQPLESLPVFRGSATHRATIPPANLPAASPLSAPADESQFFNALRQSPPVPQENENFGEAKEPSPAARPTATLPFRSPRTHKQSSKAGQPVSNREHRLPLGQHAMLVRNLASLRGDKVLHRLIHSSVAEQPLIEGEIRRRGLDPIPMPLARMLIASQAVERIRGVDTLLRTPNVRPGPWLALMADDASAEVRLVVVGLLSTSDDPELLDRAWQIALHDQDPRVARLTRTIQAKRDGTNRR